MQQKIGQLAAECGLSLPLQVLSSAAGHYIGTAADGIPYSRESVEYFASAELASAALEAGAWTQRQQA